MNENGGICTYVIQKKTTVYIPDIKEEMVNNPLSVRIFEMTGMKSNLLVPLITNEKIYGLMTFPSFQKKLYLNENQIQEVSDFVFYISNALVHMFSAIELNDIL